VLPKGSPSQIAAVNILSASIQTFVRLTQVPVGSLSSRYLRGRTKRTWRSGRRRRVYAESFDRFGRMRTQLHRRYLPPAHTARESSLLAHYRSLTTPRVLLKLALKSICL